MADPMPAYSHYYTYLPQMKTLTFTPPLILFLVPSYPNGLSLSCQYVFTIKDKDDGEVMIALMREDTRIDRDEGGKNLTIGYFIMKVWC